MIRTYRKIIIGFLFLIHCSACSSQEITPPPLKSMPVKQEAKDSVFTVKLRTRESIRKMLKQGHVKNTPITLAAVDEKEVLSLPLLVSMSYETTLCGHTKSGEWVLQGAASAKEKLVNSSLIEEIKVAKPESFVPVRDLVLIYDKPEKPSVKALQGIDLTVVKERERRTYGYMKVRYNQENKGIPPQLLKAIRKLKGVSNADASTSVSIESSFSTNKKTATNKESSVK